jgi:hypothetical protein
MIAHADEKLFEYGGLPNLQRTAALIVSDRARRIECWGAGAQVPVPWEVR